MTLENDFDPEDIDDEELDEFGDEVLEYEESATLEPARDVDLSGFRPKTLTEEEEENTNLSDLRDAMRRLSPKFPTKRMNDLLQPVMASRIFPDNFLDLNYFLVANLIEETAYDDDFDFASILTNVQVATSIGYEGRYRIEIGEIAGLAHEEDLDRISKELGI